MTNIEDLARLIEQHRGNGIDLGTEEDAPAESWLAKSEAKLGCTLPPSYRWFVDHYGGGEIAGEEVFSIYGMEFDEVHGGDIVAQYLSHQKSRTLASDEIPVSQAHSGEVFFMKASRPDAEGEYPVFIKRGSSSIEYAPNFAEYLRKRIGELLTA